MHREATDPEDDTLFSHAFSIIKHENKLNNNRANYLTVSPLAVGSVSLCGNFVVCFFFFYVSAIFTSEIDICINHITAWKQRQDISHLSTLINHTCFCILISCNISSLMLHPKNNSTHSVGSVQEEGTAPKKGEVCVHV